MTLKKTKIKPPFKADGKTSFPLRETAGVYIIYKNNKIVYVGFSRTNVYKSMYRHFYPYKDKREQARVFFDKTNNLTCRVIYTVNGNQALKLENALILKYKPKLNTNLYNGFVMDNSEEKILNKYYLEPAKDIQQYAGDIPF